MHLSRAGWLAALVAVLISGCAPQSPGSDADLSKLAASAPASPRSPGPVTVVDGPGGIKRPLINLAFVLSPFRNEAQLAFNASVNGDCSDLDGIDIRITSVPRHGTATVMHGPGFTAFDAKSAMARCNSMPHVGRQVVYRRNPGFVGVDELTYEVYVPSGQSAVFHYKIVTQ